MLKGAREGAAAKTKKKKKRGNDLGFTLKMSHVSVLLSQLWEWGSRAGECEVEFRTEKQYPGAIS